MIKLSNLKFRNAGITFRHWTLFILLPWFGGCASVALDYPKETSLALHDTDNAFLATASTSWRDSQPEQNGFYPLIEGKDAFGARLSLIDEADMSIDAQYFLMKPDNAGLVFTDKLLEAANRGVRVRLLLDDVFTTVDDSYFSFMDSQPNVEVRIFNPVSRKGLYAFNYLGHFSLANRRMHNKSFIVDNQIAIVGGRNIAEEYFQLETSGEFIDFDMLAAGPIVKQISNSFDDYWNNTLALPIKALSTTLKNEEIEEEWRLVRQAMVAAGSSIYGEAVHSQLIQQLSAGEIEPFMANARMIVDSPQKLREKISEEHQIVATELAETLENAEREVIIITPYFIPGKSGIEFVKKLRAKGLRIVLVTNSLASNNHTAVHSAYSSYRKRLLNAGVELWEVRANAVQHTGGQDKLLKEQITLHTKGILIDRRQIFVGSLNLDPRSIDINTEMGLLIDSEELVSGITDEVLINIPQIAYRLQLNDNGKITWHANIDGREVVETREPLTSAWRRFKAWVLKIAPEQQL